jgi:hypothetical protein
MLIPEALRASHLHWLQWAFRHFQFKTLRGEVSLMKHTSDEFVSSQKPSWRNCTAETWIAAVILGRPSSCHFRVENGLF